MDWGFPKPSSGEGRCLLQLPYLSCLTWGKGGETVAHWKVVGQGHRLTHHRTVDCSLPPHLTNAHEVSVKDTGDGNWKNCKPQTLFKDSVGKPRDSGTDKSKD